MVSHGGAMVSGMGVMCVPWLGRQNGALVCVGGFSVSKCAFGVSGVVVIKWCRRC